MPPPILPYLPPLSFIPPSSSPTPHSGTHFRYPDTSITYSLHTPLTHLPQKPRMEHTHSRSPLTTDYSCIQLELYYNHIPYPLSLFLPAQFQQAPATAERILDTPLRDRSLANFRPCRITWWVHIPHHVQIYDKVIAFSI